MPLTYAQRARGVYGSGGTTPAPIRAPTAAALQSSSGSGVLGLPSSVQVQARDPLSSSVFSGLPANVFDEQNSFLNQVYDELTGQAADVASSMLRGEIPEDVQRQVRQMSAENSLRQGLGAGSEASRFLTARDLGLTSTQIQQQGLAATELVTQLAEGRRQFNQEYSLRMQALQEDRARTNLSAVELAERSRQVNMQTSLQSSELLAQALSNYHEMAYRYATAEESDAATTSAQSLSTDFTSLVTRLRSLVGW